jgi:Uma2 family endonuclease
MFASRETLRTKRLRFEQGLDSLEAIGTPDLVLEVVSEHSIQKDTVVLRELYAAAGIAEYWLVNPLSDELSFEILRLTARGYAAARKNGGWVKSAVFGKSLRLEQMQGESELPDYRLLAK